MDKDPLGRRGFLKTMGALGAAGLVPGALLRNRSLRFACRIVNVVPARVSTAATAHHDSTGICA